MFDRSMSNNVRSIENNDALYGPCQVGRKFLLHLVSAGPQHSEELTRDPRHGPVSRVQNADVKFDFRFKPQRDHAAVAKVRGRERVNEADPEPLSNHARNDCRKLCLEDHVSLDLCLNEHLVDHVPADGATRQRYEWVISQVLRPDDGLRRQRMRCRHREARAPPDKNPHSPHLSERMETRRSQNRFVGPPPILRS